MYRRAVAPAVGPYDARFVMAEDAHYWMRIHRHSEMVRLPGRYFYHRLHERSLTGRDYGAYAALRVPAQARREVLGLPPRDVPLQQPRCLVRGAIVLLWARSLALAARGRAAAEFSS